MSVQQKRKNELLTIIGYYFNESNVNNITEDMIVLASEVWNILLVSRSLIDYENEIVARSTQNQ